jgi:hypothetical protein
MSERILDHCVDANSLDLGPGFSGRKELGLVKDLMRGSLAQDGGRCAAPPLGRPSPSHTHVAHALPRFGYHRPGVPVCSTRAFDPGVEFGSRLLPKEGGPCCEPVDCRGSRGCLRSRLARDDRRAVLRTLWLRGQAAGGAAGLTWRWPRGRPGVATPQGRGGGRSGALLKGLIGCDNHCGACEGGSLYVSVRLREQSDPRRPRSSYTPCCLVARLPVPPDHMLAGTQAAPHHPPTPPQAGPDDASPGAPGGTGMFGSQGAGGGGGHGGPALLPKDPEKRWLFDILANKTNGSEPPSSHRPHLAVAPLPGRGCASPVRGAWRARRGRV